MSLTVTLLIIFKDGFAGITSIVGSSVRFPSLSSPSSESSETGVFEGSKIVTDAIFESPPAFIIS